MKYLIVFIVVALSTSCGRSLSQKIGLPGNSHEQRMLVPQASTVEIVSYPSRAFWDNSLQEMPSIILTNRLDTFPDIIRDRIILNSRQIRKLNRILTAEYCYLNNRYGCYDPRHLILFYQSNGDLCEYIEICLECSNMYGSFDLGDISVCPKKIKRLTKFFKSIDITYFGHDKEEEELEAIFNRPIELKAP